MNLVVIVMRAVTVFGILPKYSEKDAHESIKKQKNMMMQTMNLQSSLCQNIWVFGSSQLFRFVAFSFFSSVVTLA